MYASGCMSLHDLVNLVSLCMGNHWKKRAYKLKVIPEKRDTTEMYPGKVVIIIAI